MRDWVTAFLAVPFVLVLGLPGLDASSPGLIQSPSFVISGARSKAISTRSWLVLRGGSDDDASDSESEREEEEEEEDVTLAQSAVKASVKAQSKKAAAVKKEEEEQEDVTLAQSAVKATVKAQSKKTAAVKKEVSAKLVTKKVKKPSALKRYIPYIVRACMNPFTVIAMTRAYFASLFNLDYLKEDASQGLRSALEEKAKKSGSAGGGRQGKRAMRPGQAKTLSDLPQLST